MLNPVDVKDIWALGDFWAAQREAIERRERNLDADRAVLGLIEKRIAEFHECFCQPGEFYMTRAEAAETAELLQIVNESHGVRETIKVIKLDDAKTGAPFYVLETWAA